ncbi:addiction module protein [Nitrospirillum iridis]|uniref:Putative addiction module component (TIGR02574 family) n=1 Tax=Nitrospirillum iridis TaxID=765888 RepID=A0A7X0EF79_9PROT|nr:addiction module protein [Nitrospirillum iridis]MBB6254712.1 putative addiction module component (TIGR02574 family) [Nitrospirillum iridis]
MTVLPFDHLTVAERLTLIDELWESLDPQDIPLTDAQKAEVDLRLATVDEDIKHGIPADELLAKLKQRYA